MTIHSKFRLAFLVLAVLLALQFPTPAWAQLYRNAAPAPRDASGSAPVEPTAVVVTTRPVEPTEPGMTAGARLSFGLLDHPNLGLGATLRVEIPLATRLFQYDDTIALGLEAGFLSGSSTVNSYDPYTDTSSPYTSSYTVVPLMMTLVWRFAIGSYFEVGPRFGLGAWVGTGGVNGAWLTGLEAAVRFSEHSHFRLYLTIDAVDVNVGLSGGVSTGISWAF